MACPLRLEFPGAIYLVTSRGNAREAIFLNNPGLYECFSFLAMRSTSFFLFLFERLEPGTKATMQTLQELAFTGKWEVGGDECEWDQLTQWPLPRVRIRSI